MTLSSSLPPEQASVPGTSSGAVDRLPTEPPLAASPQRAIRLGLAIGRMRLLRRPTRIAALLGAALMIAFALIERRIGPAGAVDRALTGVFRLVLPLVCFGIAVGVTERVSLGESVWPIARFGVSRRAVALGIILAAMSTAAALAALFAAGSIAIAFVQSPVSQPLVRDLLQTSWIAALTACAYVAWFLAFSTLLKRGRGRFIPLVADFLLGDSLGIFGAILPFGNARNLLGGIAPLYLPQAASSVILALSAVTLTAVATLRCRE